MKDDHYTIMLPDWVTSFADHYVTKVRPKTLGAQAGSPYLFPTNKVRNNNPAAMSAENELRSWVRDATILQWNADIGPHAWRHMAATALVKEGRNNIYVAAAVLNDSPSTVERAYSHLVPEDQFKEFAKLADAASKVKITWVANPR